jgi:type IV pilus assembly protein PilY1
VVQLYGTVDNGMSVQYDSNYMNWVYIHADDERRQAVSHFSSWATFDVDDEPAQELSNCATPGNDDINGTNPRIKLLFTRIQVAREVICNVATTSNKIAKLGLFAFDGDDGGTLNEGLTDMSDESSLLVAYKNSTWAIVANADAPLAETLADVWFYYKPGPSSKTYWPVDYEIAEGTVNISTSNPVTPIDYYCQSNYVVIMSDGESTKDQFDSTKFANSIFNTKPVKRNTTWTTWDDGWGDTDDKDDVAYGYTPADYNPNDTFYCPNYTCWSTNLGGSDLLDDVAYFIRHQDMFPDEHFGTDPDFGWPDDQNIYTYTIGFNADNDMLRQTAINGEGAYYRADSYEELVEAFQNVITGINLRNFAFSAITAPKKTATATNEEQTISYVGYFMPEANNSLWAGHLLAFKLEDSWGYDVNGNNVVDPLEFKYDTQEECLTESGGAECSRSLALSIGQEWDAADKLPTTRNLYTHNADTTNIIFADTDVATLQPLFGAGTTEAEALAIINKIKEPHFGDVFHSDVGYVGAPPFGKQFISNINPPLENDQTYSEYYAANENRRRVIYAGTNDGILHMIYADGAEAGEEIWGFLPDEVLPSLKKIVIENEHTYTVDGRMAAGDIWFKKGGSANNTWSTILVFGLREGGNAYYALDITSVGTSPSILWKFQDSIHSGRSWGKPVMGRIRYEGAGGDLEDKWVVFLPGGFGFNSENPTDHKGKSIFVVDAATGNLLYMIGYDPDNGGTAASTGSLEEVGVTNSGSNKYLTKSPYFNFPIPSALTAVDKNNDGYTDTIYYGNLAGHMFKTDISPLNRDDWKTSVIFKRKYIANKYSSVIKSIEDNIITLAEKGFDMGESIVGKTSWATGYIIDVDNPNRKITVLTTSGTFQVDETIVSRTYDPIYLSPAVAFDTCYQLWVTFGTGDRDRPRSNPNKGRYIAVKQCAHPRPGCLRRQQYLAEIQPER